MDLPTITTAFKIHTVTPLSNVVDLTEPDGQVREQAKHNLSVLGKRAFNPSFYTSVTTPQEMLQHGIATIVHFPLPFIDCQPFRSSPQATIFFAYGIKSPIDIEVYLLQYVNKAALTRLLAFEQPQQQSLFAHTDIDLKFSETEKESCAFLNFAHDRYPYQVQTNPFDAMRVIADQEFFFDFELPGINHNRPLVLRFYINEKDRNSEVIELLYADKFSQTDWSKRENEIAIKWHSLVGGGICEGAEVLLASIKPTRDKSGLLYIEQTGKRTHTGDWCIPLKRCAVTYKSENWRELLDDSDANLPHWAFCKKEHKGTLM